MERLQGKVALIIGGASGIGLAIARGFAAEGARIAVAARTPEKVESAAATIGGGASGHICDVRQPKSSAALFDEVIARHGALDILVNSQGVIVLKRAEEITEDDYDSILDTNLRSVFFACVAAHRHMAKRGQGSIVNIASLSAHRGWPRASAYAISKHGVLGLTRSFASEWAESGVRVNSISPGFFMTDLNRERMSAERKSMALARTPMKRFGEVDELVGAAIYLASEDSRFVTGTDIIVDGGYLAKGI